MESFLVYLFNFYYAISELEQNKQNNTTIFFFTIYFFNKKVDLSSLRGGAGAPPLPTGLLFMLWRPFFARVKINYRSIYFRILKRVPAVAMETGLVKNKA